MRQIKWLTHMPNGVKLTPSQKGVLMQLADDHNEDLGCAWPSVTKLAPRVGLSDKQCRRVLHALEAGKAIESRPRLRDDSEARRSNEYRFWFDPPFDAASTAKTEKRLRMQQLKAAQRPAQLTISAPPTDGRGVLPRTTPPPGHPRETGTPTDGRGALPSKGGQELLEEQPQELVLEPLSDPTNQPPYPPYRGAEKTAESNTHKTAQTADANKKDQDRWGAFKLELKSDLISIPASIARSKGFSVIEPSPDALPQSTTNDYDVCFRDWWLDRVERLAGEIVFYTSASDLAATQAGIVKYTQRLTRLSERYYSSVRRLPRTFVVVQQR